MIQQYVRTSLLSLLLCLSFALSGCETVVFTNISESSANDMLAYLASQGIAAQKMPGQKEQFSVLVDESDLAQSIELLSAEGLPREHYDSMGNVFKKEGVVSTPLEENARLIYALSQEVAGSIALIDGVLAARVHVVLPTTDVFGSAKAPSTAAVFIKHRYGVPIESEVSRIKQLVENSIQDLKYEHISVFLFPASPSKPFTQSPWVTILGLRVAPTSANAVWALLAICFASICISIGLWLWPRYVKKSVKDAA